MSYPLRLARLAAIRETLHASPPLLIGGTGGSGTRVFVTLCQRAGWYMGRKMTKGNDALVPHHEWVDKWLPKAQVASRREQNAGWRLRMERELLMTLHRHRGGIAHAEQAWGLKNPRFILTLPFLHETLPGMRFLHVVRDGRDMAFSSNQRQSRLFGHFWLNDESVDTPQPVRSIEFWSKTNLAAADYGESRMGNNYLRIRFEELCRQPRATIEKIYAFLEIRADFDSKMEAACSEVKEPSSIGRWQQQDASTVQRVSDAGRNALKRFGYEVP